MNGLCMCLNTWVSSVLDTDGWGLIMSNLPWGSWQTAPHPGSSPGNPHGQQEHDLHAAFAFCRHGLGLRQETSLGAIHDSSQLQSSWLPIKGMGGLWNYRTACSWSRCPGYGEQPRPLVGRGRGPGRLHLLICASHALYRHPNRLQG